MTAKIADAGSERKGKRIVIPTPTMAYKVAGAEFKAGDDGAFEGHFAIFNNIDDGGDVIKRGAFAKTIREQGHRVKVLYQHYPDRIIGARPDLLEESEKGLYAKGKIITQTFWGREAHILMREGALNEGSIGYMPIQDKTEWRDDGIRVLGEVKLFEVSPVPWGMNPLTEVNAVKAMWGRLVPGVMPEQAEAKMVDEYITALHEISIELKEGRVLSAASMGKVKNAKDALVAAVEALDALIQAAEPDGSKTDHSTLENGAQALRERLTRLEAGMSKYAQVIGV